MRGAHLRLPHDDVSHDRRFIHTVARVLHRDLHRPLGKDVEILDRACAAYAEVDLPRAPEKGFGLSSTGGKAVTDFTVIGPRSVVLVA
jgi:hypothetical protein